MCRSEPPISIIFFSNSLNVIPDMPSPFSLENRFAQDFIQRRLARCALDQTASPQRDHSLLDGLFLQLQCRRADQNQFAKLVGTGVEEKRSEEHTSELQSRQYLVCRLL